MRCPKLLIEEICGLSSLVSKESWEEQKNGYSCMVTIPVPDMHPVYVLIGLNMDIDTFDFLYSNFNVKNIYIHLYQALQWYMYIMLVGGTLYPYASHVESKSFASSIYSDTVQNPALIKCSVLNKRSQTLTSRQPWTSHGCGRNVLNNQYNNFFSWKEIMKLMVFGSVFQVLEHNKII